MSICTVCNTDQRRTSRDTWYWHNPEPTKLYFLCSEECKEVYQMNPLAYEDRVQPETVKCTQLSNITYRSRLGYWQEHFWDKRLR